MQPSEQCFIFLDTIYKHTPINTWFAVRLITPEGKHSDHFFKAKDKAKLLDFLTTQKGVNVFARVTVLKERPEKGRGKALDSAGTSVLWVDCDKYDDLHSFLAQLEQLPLPPSVIIHSGKGIHAYWLLDKFETDLTAIKAANIAIGEQLNALQPDSADHCFDLARVLRVPGSLNYKHAHTPLVHFLSQTDRIYALAQFPKSAKQLQPIIINDPLPIPDDFMEAINNQDKKLYYRLKSPETAIKKADAALRPNSNELDRSRNDAVCITKLLALGYSPEQCITAMLDPRLTIGLRYAENKRYDYVATTVNKVATHFQDSPMRFYINNKLQIHRLVEHIASTPCDDTTAFIYTTEKLWHYENGFFNANGEQFVKRVLREKLNNKVTIAQINEVLAGLADLNTLAYSDCNRASGTLVNVRNGMLNIHTGEMLPHCMSYRSLYQLPAIFDPTVNTTEIDHYLESVIPLDTIPFFWEFIGSTLLTNVYWPKAFLVLVGAGDTGKSTLLAFITAVLGADYVKKYSLHTLAEGQFSKAGLVGKLANIFSDLDAREIGAVGQIKMLTGNDEMSAERKFKDSFDFTNKARLIFSANDYPLIREPDIPYFNRAKIIPCANVFDPSKANRNLLQELITPTNLSAALFRMIEGLQRLLKQQDFSATTSVAHASNEYMLRADNVCGFLDICPKIIGAKIRKSDLYASYVHFCKDVGKHHVSQDNFFKRVINMQQRYGIEDRRENTPTGNKESYYINITAPDRRLAMTF